MSEDQHIMDPVEGTEEDAFIDQDEVEEVEDVMDDGEDIMEDDDEGEGEGEGAGEGEGEGNEQTINDDDLFGEGLNDSIAVFSGSGDAVYTVAVNPADAGVAASGGQDDNAYIWSTQTGALLQTLDGHTDTVVSVAFNFDGEYVASGGMDGQIRVWQRTPGTQGYESWTFKNSLDGLEEVTFLDWHPRGNVLLVGSSDGTVWMWQPPRGEVMHVLAGHEAPVVCGRFSPGGQHILTASEDSTLIFWDPKTGNQLFKLGQNDMRFFIEGGITCLAINPASTVAVVGGEAGALRAVNLTNGSLIAQLDGHSDDASIESVAFAEIPLTATTSTVGLVSVGTDHKVNTYETANFKLRRSMTHEDAVTSLAFVPGTSQFVTGSVDKTLKLWDYKTGESLQTFLGHRDVIHCVAVNKEGLIVSGSDDNSARVFKIGHSAESMDTDL